MAVLRSRGVSPLNEDQIAERGARVVRRDDREYREYLREEQRRQLECPAREVVLDQRRHATCGVIRLLATLIVTWLFWATPAAQAPPTLENDVKAAFLFNFTKFVEWPETAFQGTTDPLRLCVVADAAFTRSVDAIIAGETVRGRPLRRVTPAVSEVGECHVLYVGAAESQQAERLLSSVARAPVLTVGDSSRFIAQGGAISFVLVNDRVRFDVNLRAAQRAGLTVSSQLLRVARHVENRRL